MSGKPASILENLKNAVFTDVICGDRFTNNNNNNNNNNYINNKSYTYVILYKSVLYSNDTQYSIH